MTDYLRLPFFLDRIRFAFGAAFLAVFDLRDFPLEGALARRRLAMGFLAGFFARFLAAFLGGRLAALLGARFGAFTGGRFAALAGGGSPAACSLSTSITRGAGASWAVVPSPSR